MNLVCELELKLVFIFWSCDEIEFVFVIIVLLGFLAVPRQYDQFPKSHGPALHAALESGAPLRRAQTERFSSAGQANWR